MLEASFEPFISCWCCWQTLIQCALLYHQRKPSICNRNKFRSVHLPRINAFGFRLQSSCQFGACPWYSGETVSELFEYQELQTTDWDFVWIVAWCRWPDSCWQQRMGLLRLCWGSTSAKAMAQLQTPQLISMEWSETTREGSWNNTTGKLQRDGLGHILRAGCGTLMSHMDTYDTRTRRCLFPLIFRDQIDKCDKYPPIINRRRTF